MMNKKKFFIGFILIAAGVILSFPLFSITYYTMVRTSTPHFCAVCHEIQYAYNTWVTSSHASNSNGVVADCMDCHLPAPHDTYNFFYSKTFHGIKDIVAHFVQEEYDREKNRQAAYDYIKNEQCQKCHRNILYIPYKRGAMLAHRTVLYPRQGYEKKCVDCHRNLVHYKKLNFEYSANY